MLQTNADDARFMAMALALAARGLGAVWPNPAVGCVLARDGAVVGRGWTQPGGRPHAETEALRRAGDLARGAVCYVSLEPCSHHGATAPCADALIAAGVGRVVAAVRDPDPRVAGAGLRRLEAAGIPVSLGVLEEAAAELNAGFFSRLARGRPLVTLKVATTLDGRIATRSGESRWITGPAARARAHLLRAGHDAVMVGAGTALADDPALTCRLPGLDRRRPPVRIVVAGRRPLAPGLALVRTARQVPTWLLAPAAAASAAALAGQGVEVIEAGADADGRVDLEAGLRALGARGLTRLLVEGGSGLATALLRAGLVDRLAWFRAPRLIGGDGLPALGALGVAGLGEAVALRRLAVEPVGDDLLETYAVRS